MNPRLIEKLNEIKIEWDKIQVELSNPEVISDQKIPEISIIFS